MATISINIPDALIDSSSRAALGVMRRMPARGRGLRLTVDGTRLRISGLASRRSHFRAGPE
jgi:hypothetical protein